MLCLQAAFWQRHPTIGWLFNLLSPMRLHLYIYSIFMYILSYSIYSIDTRNSRCIGLYRQLILPPNICVLCIHTYLYYVCIYIYISTCTLYTHQLTVVLDLIFVARRSVCWRTRWPRRRSPCRWTRHRLALSDWEGDPLNISERQIFFRYWNGDWKHKTSSWRNCIIESIYIYG